MQTFASSGASGDVQYGRYAALLSFKGNAEGKFNFKSKCTHGIKGNAKGIEVQIKVYSRPIPRVSKKEEVG